MKRIPVAGPWITEKEVRYVAQAAEHGWYERANEFPQRFEQAFANEVGVRYAVALPHCTSAIHLALVALSIGPGDEVIVPETTWVATAAPVRYVGATPVFADIDPRTWCLCPHSVEKRITHRTRAILPVDLYGSLADYEALKKISSVPIIEDAAQSVGAHREGKKAGSFGKVGVFSFHGSKTVTTGEGGMLVTDDEPLYKRVLFLRDHGREPGDKLFLSSQVAFKYRMSAVAAALGLAQIERLEELVAKKRLIFSWYYERLNGLAGLTLNEKEPGFFHTYWMVTALWNCAYSLDKFSMMQQLSEHGIDSRPFFAPLSSLGAFSPYRKDYDKTNPVAYRLGNNGINLPSALCLTEQDVDYVCSVFKKILQKARVGPARKDLTPLQLGC